MPASSGKPTPNRGLGYMQKLRGNTKRCRAIVKKNGGHPNQALVPVQICTAASNNGARSCAWDVTTTVNDIKCECIRIRWGWMP